MRACAPELRNLCRLQGPQKVSQDINCSVPALTNEVIGTFDIPSRATWEERFCGTLY